MAMTCSSVVRATHDDVFHWHERAGAITRLTPPWQPVRVARESGSLRDGRAVLTVPPGIRWVAQHRNDGFDPPHRFVDEQTSLPLRWRHVHEFAPAERHATHVTDRVDTCVPAKLLRAMFVYRHSQLADDLAAHQWAAQYTRSLTVALTGSSGLVGAALAAFLSSGGHRVIRLVRREPRGFDERRWRPDSPHPRLLDGVDAVVHLAGASIAGPFTAAHKRAVRDSRVEPTRELAALAGRARVNAFVTASAIGYYGPDRGETELTETSERGSGFLADVVGDWEDASAPAATAGVRVVRVRTGIVQCPRGGMLRLLYPLFAAGVGGRLGHGQQWTSWIGIDDLLDVYYRALVSPGLSGAVNAVAPNPVRNVEYARTLARVLRRPAPLPVPSAGPRLLLGAEGASEFAEASQYVRPDRLLAVGHRFRHAELDTALRHLLGHEVPRNDARFAFAGAHPPSCP